MKLQKKETPITEALNIMSRVGTLLVVIRNGGLLSIDQH